MSLRLRLVRPFAPFKSWCRPQLIGDKRAITDGLAFQAFSAEYITNILEARARALPEPGPLQLTRRHDLLDIDIAPPDLNAYEVDDYDRD